VFGRVSKDIGNGAFQVGSVLLDLRTAKFTVLALGVGLRTGNSQGWVAGPGRDGLVVASQGARTGLPALAGGAGTGPSMDDVVTMSEDGRVLGGQTVDGTGQIQAVRWTCTRA